MNFYPKTCSKIDWYIIQSMAKRRVKWASGKQTWHKSTLESSWNIIH